MRCQNKSNRKKCIWTKIRSGTFVFQLNTNIFLYEIINLVQTRKMPTYLKKNFKKESTGTEEFLGF